jgi:hypothetical protein
MAKRQLSTRAIFLIAGTRVALGVGIGLVISERLNLRQRRSAGWTLIALGAASTVPLAIHVFRRNTGLVDISGQQAA